MATSSLLPLNKINTYKPNRRNAVIFVLAFAMIGGIFLFATHAATPYVSVDSESGTLTSGASIISDAAASGGKAIKFSNGNRTPGIWTNIAPPQVSTDFNNPTNNYGFNTIVPDPTNPNVLFIGTNYQGLWKSTDQGTTWAKVNTGTGGNLLDQGRVWSLAIDPFNHNILWATSGYGAGGPLKSTDGGISWTLVPTPNPPVQGNDVYSVNIDPYTANHILLAYHYYWNFNGNNANDSGVLETTDGGATWVIHYPPTGSGWSAGNAVWFLNNSQTWLLGSQNGGIWRTTNSGTNWSQVRTMDITHGGINALYRNPATGTLYLAGFGTVAISSDNGATWTDTTGLPNAYYETVVSDGTNIYTAPSFPIANYIDGPWYSFKINGGTSWQTDNASPHTCYNSQCNGPVMGVYDSTNHIGYAVNWLGGVWKRQGP